MSIIKDIKLIAESMEIGETIRQVCPSCWGGSSHEHSLTITLFPNNIVKYNCFRSKCSLKGSHTRSGANPLHQPDIAKPVIAKRKKFDGVTVPLTKFDEDWIWKIWGISKAPYWYHTPQFGGRVAMSVRSPTYKHRGWVLRDIMGQSSTKVLTYIEDGQTPLSWYKDKKGLRGTIVVEDIPSAVRASKYINAVALLGTGAGLERAIEIDEHAPRPILIALDQDATQEAFNMLERWSMLWGAARVLPLKKDLKDTAEDDLQTIIESCVR